MRTLLLVDTKDNHRLLAADTDELANRADTTTGKLREQNHAWGGPP